MSGSNSGPGGGNSGPGGNNGGNQGPGGHEQTVNVVVNGRQKPWPKNTEISFAQVIALAFENPPTGDGVQFTVQYTRGEGNKPSGTLLEGQTVKVKDGMIFDVTATNRS
jgi:Multiubiquitin